MPKAVADWELQVCTTDCCSGARFPRERKAATIARLRLPGGRSPSSDPPEPDEAGDQQGQGGRHGDRGQEYARVGREAHAGWQDEPDAGGIAEIKVAAPGEAHDRNHDRIVAVDLILSEKMGGALCAPRAGKVTETSGARVCKVELCAGYRVSGIGCLTIPCVRRIDIQVITDTSVGSGEE